MVAGGCSKAARPEAGPQPDEVSRWAKTAPEQGSGTFPVDWPNFGPSTYDNNARLHSWDSRIWGRYRIPLDELSPFRLPYVGHAGLESPNSIRSGVFIHGGIPGNPTFGCIRLTQEGAMEELVDYLQQLDEPLRLFVTTPPLPSRPTGGNTVWYNPFEKFEYTIRDGTQTQTPVKGVEKKKK